MNTKTRSLTVGMALLLMVLSLTTAVTLTAPRIVRADPGVRYAAPAAQGNGDCSSWANACTLQTALAQAVSGDEIWVKAGVHYPGTNRTDTFQLKNGVAVYGGFAGTETSRSQRNWVVNKTILSGDIDGNDNHGGDYINENASQIVGNNAYHVVTGSGTNSTAVLNGFIITAGQANGSYPNNRGGGMDNYDSSPTLTNVTFSGNSAYSGGGMYNYDSSPTLTNVTFSGNSASSYGGGMYNYHSSPTLTNVTFSGNSASSYGGGMYNDYNSSPTLTNVILWGDTAPNGPEIYNDSSTPVVSYSDIQGGYAGTGNINANPLFVNAAGGDLHLQPTSPAIDAGNNAAVPSGVTSDLDGNPRFFDVLTVPDTGSGTPPIVDMGAYEKGPLHAAPSAQGSGDCYSWANACTLKTALTNAVGGDEIWVKAGVHYPGTNRTDTFQLKNGVAVYGGFAGTETSRSQRNWVVNKTILSGDIDQNDTNTDGNFIAETWNDIQGSNAYHVVTSSGTNSTAVLDGFIITAGQANGNTGNDGGGMYNYDSSPTLTNVTFSGNSAPYGGGMYNYNSSPTLTNVTFSGNSATEGGGMLNYNSSPTLTNVTFSGNSAPYGGGMFNYNSSPTLTNVTFSGNSAPYGGGMFNYYNSSPTLTNVTFSGNSASTDGGGMYNDYNSSPTLTNVTFSGNSANNRGGGMYNHSYSNPTLTNVILWGDTASNGPEIYNDSSSATISYSLIQGGCPAGATCGAGMLYVDPLFVNAAGGNLRLGFGSPAIDAGNNAAVPPGVTTDLDGRPRFMDISYRPRYRLWHTAHRGYGAPMRSSTMWMWRWTKPHRRCWLRRARPLPSP